MYFVATSIAGDNTFVVKPTEQGTMWIPLDTANCDYQEYLAWLAEGNEPGVWPPEEVSE